MTEAHFDLIAEQVELPDTVTVCPECGRHCNGSVGLGVHRSVKHGVHGTKHHPSKAKKKRTVGKVSRPVTQLPTKAQEYDSLPDWTVDEIFTSVVGMLFPSGSIPTRSLPLLVEWHAATERMLRGL